MVFLSSKKKDIRLEIDTAIANVSASEMVKARFFPGELANGMQTYNQT